MPVERVMHTPPAQAAVQQERVGYRQCPRLMLKFRQRQSASNAFQIDDGRFLQDTSPGKSDPPVGSACQFYCNEESS